MVKRVLLSEKRYDDDPPGDFWHARRCWAEFEADGSLRIDYEVATKTYPEWRPSYDEGATMTPSEVAGLRSFLRTDQEKGCP